MDSKFSYPILNYDGIVSALSHLNYKTTPSALQQPTSELVHAILAHLWYSLSNTSHEELLRQLSRDTSGLNDPATLLYEDSMVVVVQFHLYRSIMQVVGVNDVKLLDIEDPDPKRLRKHLSGLLNCIHFSGQIQEKMRAAVDPEATQQLNSELNIARRECEDAQLQCEVLKNQLDEEYEASQKALQDHSAADSDLQTVIATCTSLDEETQHTKRLLADKEKENKELEEEIVVLDAEIEELEQAVLKQDPVQLERNLTAKKRQINELRNSVSEMEKSRADLEVDAQNISRNLIRGEKKLHMFEEVKKSYTDRTEVAQSLVKEVEELEEQMLSVQAEIRGKKVEIENAHAEQEQINAQISRLKSEVEQRHAAHEQERIRIENKKKKHATRLASYERETEDIRSESTHLRETIRQRKEEAVKRQQCAAEIEHKLRTEIERYEHYIEENVTHIAQMHHLKNG